jgi:hypothetical protein
MKSALTPFHKPDKIVHRNVFDQVFHRDRCTNFNHASLLSTGQAGISPSIWKDLYLQNEHEYWNAKLSKGHPEASDKFIVSSPKVSGANELIKYCTNE